MKGRYIGENIRLLYDTLLYAKQHQIPGLLLMVDFEKAFDSVGWSFIEKSLCKFKFGKDITQWILTFYTNINSCVHVNGQYSQWFDVKRGTRQGDPLSPYLFLICAELLASMIRQNENIHGINILDEEILLSQFADDTTFFLDGTRESFCSCMCVLQQFASMSGLNINVDKTKAVWIGSRRNSKLRFMPEINLDWNPVTFTVLGVVFSTDVLEIVTINFENKLNEMKKVLNAWSRRNLTPFGRITVIKSLVISKITHLLMNLPDPEESFLKELNKLLYNFLWNGKNDKIRRSGVCQAYEVGGLKMVDIKSFLSAFKISWLKRILHDDGKLSKILQAMCPLIQNVKQRGGEFANIIMQRVKNPFWFDVFKHYKKISAKCTPVTFDDFVSECLHYNVNICRGKRVVCIRNWMDCGIVSLGHLVGPHGYLSYNEFKAKFPNVRTDFLLYEGILTAVKCYQRRLGLAVKENFVIGDAFVWRFLYKSSVKDIYSCLVRTSETPKCIEKWSKVLAVETDTKAVFDKIFRTTREKCLIWFQYKLLYNLLPTGRFLFQRQLVDSPVCVFCKDAEETLVHMFWDCPKIQNYWFDVQGWLHTSFTHCTDIIFSKELVILGSKANVVTDRILDLCILIAKYNIFIAKLHGTIPHLNVFTRFLKNRAVLEKYYYTLNGRSNKFHAEWMLYSSLFS